MGDAAKYATAFALRKAWGSWNEGERALMLWHTGLTEADVMSVNLQMIQLRDLPGFIKHESQQFSLTCKNN